MVAAHFQKVYYAHALCEYRYPREAQALEQIAARFPAAELVNPGAYGYFPGEFSFFLGLVGQSDVLVFQRLYSQITQGVGKEIRHALQSNKTVYELTEEGRFLRVTEPPTFCDLEETQALYRRCRAEQGVRNIPLLVPKANYSQVKEQGAEWNEKEQVWHWPSHKPLELVAGWLPRLEQRRAQPPYLLSGMIPASIWGQNLRSLYRDRWKKLSREIREQCGHRCQICGGASMGCHEEWEYEYNASASSGYGVQRLREVVSLCEACHVVKHLGRAALQGQTKAAMRHWAFVNGWPLRKADKERDKAWLGWQHRNQFRWRLDLSWIKWHYGWPIAEAVSDKECLPKTLSLFPAVSSAVTVFYARPYYLCGSGEERCALERLSSEFPGAKIINPEPRRWPSPEWFHREIELCDLLVFKRLKNQITEEVGLKVNYALSCGKPVLELPESNPYLKQVTRPVSF